MPNTSSHEKLLLEYGRREIPASCPECGNHIWCYLDRPISNLSDVYLDCNNCMNKGCVKQDGEVLEISMIEWFSSYYNGINLSLDLLGNIMSDEEVKIIESVLRGMKEHDDTNNQSILRKIENDD